MEQAKQTLQRVHHIAVSVADLDKSIQWYQTSFCCELVMQDKTQAVLQFENIRIVLVLPSLEPAHIAFEKQDAGLFGELRDRTGGIKSTYLADPTGNMLELVVPSNPSA